MNALQLRSLESEEQEPPTYHVVKKGLCRYRCARCSKQLKVGDRVTMPDISPETEISVLHILC